MYDLGLRLKEIRSRRGLTQKALARRINKSVSAVMHQKKQHPINGASILKYSMSN